MRGVVASRQDIVQEFHVAAYAIPDYIIVLYAIRKMTRIFRDGRVLQ